MKNALRITGILIVAVIVIICSCARQASPAGGPKDITPPAIVKSEPPSGTTNFDNNRISITFNEYIKLDKLNEKFMVSPPMNEKPKIYLKGKSLVIDLLEKLKDSTTYTLYFQNAIGDLNEGNPINNYQYVFATGNVIDSLSLTGNVLISENLEPGKNILVMLHRMLADTAPEKILPDYISMAEINGGFRINNIKEGDYRLFALLDNNNNKKYDLSDEMFAFYDSVVNINPVHNWLPEKKDTASISRGDTAKPEIQEIDGEYKLFLFTAPGKSRYLTSSSRKLPYQMVYTLSLPPDTMKFDFRLADTDNKSYFIEKSKNQDTITVWLLDSTLYSNPQINTLVTYPFTDSTDANVSKLDTIQMRFLAPRPTRGKPKRIPFKYALNFSGSGIKPGHRFIITSPTPFRQPDTSRIRLYEILQKTKIPVRYRLIADSTNTRRYEMETGKLKEDGKYLFIADSAAFGNIYGEVSDSAGINFVVRPTNSFGHLELNIKNGEGNLIIQLLDNQEKLIGEKRIIKEGVVKFPMLEKGNYRVRTIYDLNGDGSWTTGNYSKRLQPEPVSYYPGEIEIKIDWEVNNEWDVSSRNVKDKSLKGKPQG